MALKSPLMPSPTTGSLTSAFSPFSDSPNSPARFAGFSPSNRSSGATDSLAPPPSPYPQQVEPSPVDSNGTEGTDFDEDEQEHEDTDVASPDSDTHGDELGLHSPDIEITSPGSTKSDNPPRIDTQLPSRLRADSAEKDPPSVIHVPSGFRHFGSGNQLQASSPDSQSNQSPNLLASPSTPEAVSIEPTDKKQASVVSPVNTDVPRVAERPTPRAQNKHDLDEGWKRKSRRTSSLEDIPETRDKDVEERPSQSDMGDKSELASESGKSASSGYEAPSNGEVIALRAALGECWTLCNTLASLSSGHRQKSFHFQGKSDVQEHAWRSCWRLCQQLYDSKDDDRTAEVIPTLELCRNFCQSLFDARKRTHEASDSVLRVSFELNNHLYNIHDRNLPEAFVERTLEFYITLCHRLMKMPTDLPREMDALLRACWSLAEMLLNLRQNSREGRQADEELLGSAVQACWELCDLFREGWTQIRPERSTPRAIQSAFGSHTSLKSSSTRGSTGHSTSSTISNRNYHEASTFPPETPVTVFDDVSSTNSSPDSTSAPNILVLGPAGSSGSSQVPAHHDRWTSSASVLSDYSESAISGSPRSSSTATAGGEATHLARLRCLLLKAGQNTGYTWNAGQSLPAYVKALPDNAFGTLPWQMKVLNYYRKLVTNDESLLNVHSVAGRRLGAAEVAKSVRWLGNGEQWAWMRDLFRLVFGFGVDEADRRGGSFQT